MESSSYASVVLNVLRYEKEAFWMENRHLSPDDIQRLWTAKNADLTTVLGPAAPLERVDLGLESHCAPAPSRMLQTLSQTPSHDLPAHDMDRLNYPSQGSTPMSRKRSSSSQYGPSPYTSSGGISLPITINNYQADAEEPFSSYSTSTDRPSKYHRTGNGRHTLIPVDENLQDSLLEHDQTCLSPTAYVPRYQHPRPQPHRLSSSPRQAPMFNSTLSQSPTTPTTGELTNATTLMSASMSRQSSAAVSSFCGGLSMLKLNSQSSDVISNISMNEGDSVPASSINEPSIQISDIDSSYFVDHTGGMVHDACSQSSTVPLIFPIFPFSSQSAEDTSMKRSSSTETNASAQSRLSRRSQEQGILSSRPLAPKVHGGESLSMESSLPKHPIVRIQTEDGSSKNVVSIAKAPHARTPHEKVMCTMCTERPEGFRGDHELRRHTDRKHSANHKVWVCVDISKHQKFLSSCKKCTSGKTYNAYYNAAAHLRRTHFNPKKPKTINGKSVPKEKRGGKGGGNEPSMDTLKLWMCEITVRRPIKNHSHATGDEELDDEEEEEEEEEEEGSPGMEDVSDLLNKTTEKASQGLFSIDRSPHSSLEPLLIPTTPFDNSHATYLTDNDPTSLFPPAITPPTQQDDSSSLQLTTSSADSTELFDLSHETSIHATELIFGMSPFDNLDFPYGLDDKFPSSF